MNALLVSKEKANVGDIARVELLIRSGLLARIDEAAQRMGLSRSAFVRLACVKLAEEGIGSTGREATHDRE